MPLLHVIKKWRKINFHYPEVKTFFVCARFDLLNCSILLYYIFLFLPFLGFYLLLLRAIFAYMYWLVYYTGFHVFASQKPTFTPTIYQSINVSLLFNISFCFIVAIQQHWGFVWTAWISFPFLTAYGMRSLAHNAKFLCLLLMFVLQDPWWFRVACARLQSPPTSACTCRALITILILSLHR